MYLLNLALIAEIITSNFSPHGPRSAWAVTGIYWVSVIVLSTLLYKYYEKPMMDLRDKVKIP
jgi:peptidoglycan/LPS O-acetylase OafA/YrhL